jgi:VirB8 protein
VPRYVGTADLPEAVRRHLLGEYVIHRERYVAALAEVDYEATGAFHTAPMNEAWSRQWARSNPESPLNRYADGSLVTVQIRSIAFLKHDENTDVVSPCRAVDAGCAGTCGRLGRDHFLYLHQTLGGLAPTHGQSTGF